jgi:AraC family ethanolamine operon transcriptional activator
MISTGGLSAACRVFVDTYPGIDHFTRRMSSLCDVVGTQLGCGPGQVQFAAAVYESVAAFGFSLDTKTLLRGRYRYDLVTIIPITSASAGGKYRGQTLRQGQIIWGAGGSDFHQLIEAGHSLVGLAVPKGLLCSLPGMTADGELRPELRQSRLLTIRPLLFDQFVANLNRVIEDVQVGLEPECTEDEILEELLLPWLGQVRGVREGASAKARQLIVEKAEEIMVANLANNLPMREICQELDVSLRTIYYAFQSRLGMTPLDFYKSLRLAKAKELLQTSQLSVRQISLAVGFHHGGWFAKDYFDRYGMLPYEALRGSQRTVPVSPLPFRGGYVGGRLAMA